jgi:DUF971 family protein
MAGPQPKVIQRSNPSRVEIEWQDGGTTSLSAAELRRKCPCAQCVDEMSGIRTLDVNAVSEELTQAELHLVGNYALSLTFSDGHHTGIFTWAHLHSWADDKS